MSTVVRVCLDQRLFDPRLRAPVQRRRLFWICRTRCQLRGNGDGTFASPVRQPVSDRNLRSLVTGDLNGDGKPDLATADYGNNRVAALLNTGNGGFGNAIHYPVGVNAREVALGDFNGDHSLDLAVANEGGMVSMLATNGPATFTAAAAYAIGHLPVALAAGDFDRDGRLDVAAVNQQANTISVLLNRGCQ